LLPHNSVLQINSRGEIELFPRSQARGAAAHPVNEQLVWPLKHGITAIFR
jgi:hypothetical protein